MLTGRAGACDPCRTRRLSAHRANESNQRRQRPANPTDTPGAEQQAPTHRQAVRDLLAAVDSLTLAMAKATAQNNRGELRYGDRVLTEWQDAIDRLAAANAVVKRGTPG